MLNDAACGPSPNRGDGRGGLDRGRDFVLNMAIHRRSWRSTGALMAVVAVAALAMVAHASRRHGGRRDFYLKRADAYASRRVEFAAKAAEARQRATAYLRLAESAEEGTADKNRRFAEDELLRASLYRRVAEFDGVMEDRYRGAADRPWAPPPLETSGPGQGLPGPLSP